MRLLEPNQSLDVKLYYSGEEARQWFSALTLQEEHSFFLNELVDLAYIVLYSILFYGMFPPTPIRYIAFIPGVCDFIETGFQMFYLQTKDYSAVFDWLGFFTCMKWVSLVLVLTTALFLFIKNKNYSHEK